MEMDLLNADPIQEESMHKLKKLVQAPNSFFLDVRCPQCLNISTIFSHSQTSVTCNTCGQILCTTSGGRAKLTTGSSYRRKGD
jgi:small subunit ribosomal protein S27e